MIKNELRGCIGTFAPSQLSLILGKYALISALQDDRFDPVTLEEVKILNVGVSLLVNFQEGKKALEWEVGKHGIVIDATYKGRHYSATFLPEVAA
jgi:AMME syndrome candidate gene 1 protein